METLPELNPWAIAMLRNPWQTCKMHNSCGCSSYSSDNIYSAASPGSIGHLADTNHAPCAPKYKLGLVHYHLKTVHDGECLASKQTRMIKKLKKLKSKQGLKLQKVKEQGTKFWNERT